MKKKKILLILILTMTCIFSACSSKEPIATDTNTSFRAAYEVLEQRYEDNGIKIKYPAVVGMSDRQQEVRINTLIENEVFEVLKYYQGSLKDLTLEIDYTVHLKGTNLLSIAYYGTGYVQGAAHPNNIFFTTNINLKDVTKIRLKDYANIDSSFIEKFKNGRYVVFDYETNVENEVREELNNYSTEDLIKYFNNADEISDMNPLNVFTYISKNYIGVGISVPHAIGDHAEFEINDDDIKDNIKEDSEVYRELCLEPAEQKQ